MNADKYLFIALLCAGCASSKREPQKPPTEGPESVEPPARVSPLAEAMQDHWALTVWTRDAVIAGHLDAAGKGARVLATNEPDKSVPDWTPFIEQMREQARRVVAATTLDEAAAGVGALGATCGECHVETGAVLQFSEVEAPPSSTEVNSHMARHAWASRVMWQGLVGPSDEQWTAGADALRDRPLHEQEYFQQWVLTEDLVALGTKVHDVGIAAHDAPRADRGRLFGQLISTCGDCHSALVR